MNELALLLLLLLLPEWFPVTASETRHFSRVRTSGRHSHDLFVTARWLKLGPRLKAPKMTQTKAMAYNRVREGRVAPGVQVHSDLGIFAVQGPSTELGSISRAHLGPVEANGAGRIQGQDSEAMFTFPRSCSSFFRRRP